MIEYYIVNKRITNGPHGLVEVQDGVITHANPSTAIGKKLADYKATTFILARRCTECRTYLEIYAFALKKGGSRRYVCNHCHRAAQATRYDKTKAV